MTGAPARTTSLTEVTTVDQLGALVAERRRELGLTQAELARRSGVSRQWLVGFERGRSNVTTGHALRTLRSLDLHLALEPAAPAGE